MIDLSLLAAVQPTVPPTPAWGTNVAIAMGLCNIIGLIIANIGIQNKGAGPALPFPLPGVDRKFGVPEFIAGLSIGHILGTGAILGLTNSGLF